MYNVCFFFLYVFCLKTSLFQKELSEPLSKLQIGLHVNRPLFCADFSETLIFSTYFRKILNYKTP